MQCRSKKYIKNYIIIDFSPGDTITVEDEDSSVLEAVHLCCRGWSHRNLLELEAGMRPATVEDSLDTKLAQLRCWLQIVRDSFQEEQILDILESGTGNSVGNWKV